MPDISHDEIKRRILLIDPTLKPVAHTPDEQDWWYEAVTEARRVIEAPTFNRAIALLKKFGWGAERESAATLRNCADEWKARVEVFSVNHHVSYQRDRNTYRASLFPFKKAGYFGPEISVLIKNEITPSGDKLRWSKPMISCGTISNVSKTQADRYARALLAAVIIAEEMKYTLGEKQGKP